MIYINLIFKDFNYFLIFFLLFIIIKLSLINKIKGNFIMFLNKKKLNLFNKRVLVRLDLNVPINNGIILSDVRIKSSLCTINYLINKGAKVILCSHLGRPKEGIYDEKLSLFPVCERLNKLLNVNVIFIKNYLYEEINFDIINNKNIILLENVRFNKGESKNSINLSKKYSKLCDIFVMDAFATSHRINSSTYGICSFVKKFYLGLLFKKEIDFLSKILIKPKRPLVSIVGGAKISTKFKVLDSLAKISDYLIVGGGISNTFLASKYNIGNSLYEKNFINLAKKLMFKYKNIILPIDCRVGDDFSELSKSYCKNLNNIKFNEEIMDIGDKSLKLYYDIIIKAKTILWNGPVGVFEFLNFRKGTEYVSKAIFNSKAFIVAGGGDTISCIELFNIKKNISYISTGGGAFLYYIEKKTLPILKLLNK